MAGIVYMFSLWSLWIYSTFIMDKNARLRTFIAITALILIILYPLELQVFTFLITGPACVLVIIGYVYMAKLPLGKKFFLLFSILILMLGYTGFLLLEMYDPVWIMVDRRIIICFFLFSLSYFLYPASLISRIILIMLGTIQGEILFSLILDRWSFPYVIGARQYLDILSLASLSLLVSHISIKLINFQRAGSGQKIMK